MKLTEDHAPVQAVDLEWLRAVLRAHPRADGIGFIGPGPDDRVLVRRSKLSVVLRLARRRLPGPWRAHFEWRGALSSLLVFSWRDGRGGLRLVSCSECPDWQRNRHPSELRRGRCVWVAPGGTPTPPPT